MKKVMIILTVMMTVINVFSQPDEQIRMTAKALANNFKILNELDQTSITIIDSILDKDSLSNQEKFDLMGSNANLTTFVENASASITELALYSDILGTNNEEILNKLYNYFMEEMGCDNSIPPPLNCEQWKNKTRHNMHQWRICLGAGIAGCGLSGPGFLPCAIIVGIGCGMTYGDQQQSINEDYPGCAGTPYMFTLNPYFDVNNDKN